VLFCGQGLASSQVALATPFGGSPLLVDASVDAAAPGITVTLSGQAWPADQATIEVQFQDVYGSLVASADLTLLDATSGTFTVPTLPIGDYSIRLWFMPGGAATNGRVFEVLEEDPGPDPPPAQCFDGTLDGNVTGTGSCADPWSIDLKQLAPGDPFYLQRALPTGDQGITLSACTDSDPREGVLSVQLPNSARILDVSVAANGAGGDPTLTILEAPSCGQPQNACGNQGGAEACEYVRASEDLGQFYGSAGVVLSDSADASIVYTISVRYFE
jgi:hypothetical protein